MKSREAMWPAEPKLEAFLSDLAVRGKVGVSTQNQAFNALLFVYREVLHVQVGNIDSVRATRPVRVPAGALFRKGEQWAAFVVSDGLSRLRIVKAGRSSGTETQVLEGLKEGEEVILYPGSRVRDGQRVTPIML